MTRRSRLMTRPRLESLENRAVLTALTPAQLTAAYGLNNITFPSNGATVKGDGSGQTIAIIDVDHDANLATELATFDAKYGLAAPTLTVHTMAGAGTDPGWAGEEALDVEWAHAAAPGAKLLVVEARSASTTDLIAAINYAKSQASALGVSVVSMSFGASEQSSQTLYDGTFTTAAGQPGITYVASSGDSGVGAEWPAASPNVVAVGGTSLTVSSTGTRATETAWSGSGGGASRIEAEPSYQSVVQSTGRRETPDVALDADPNTGVLIYSVANGGWAQVGGTSLAAPVFAGLVAIADQGRHLAGLAPLDGATQTLPDLYAAPTGSYTDVTAGSRTAIGYDTSTGLGVPNAKVLVAALVGDPAVGAASVTPTSYVETVLGGTTTGSGTGTTGTGTTGTGTGTTSPPRHPFGGWWWFGGYFGRMATTTSSASSWGGPSVAKNSGQAVARASTPTTTTVSLPRVHLGVTQVLGSHASHAAHRSVDAIVDRWSQAATA